MRYLAARCALVFAVAVCAGGWLRAETVQQLGKPKDYVNDYANVLSAQTKQQLNLLCGQMDHRANAQIFTAIIQQLPEDEDIDDFASKLQESWKAGEKRHRPRCPGRAGGPGPQVPHRGGLRA